MARVAALVTVLLIELLVVPSSAWLSASATSQRSAELQASLAELEDLRINPVTKVVNLLTDMKIQVEKEADEDKEIYEKMDCWCKTNDREKSRALEIAEEKINELEAFIEESAAKVAQLEGEIEKLKEDIAANIKALEKATAMREKEAAEFSVEEKDMMDVVSALEQALEILGKVQLMQKNGKLQEAGNALMQLKKTLKKSIGGSVHFKDVMQKDLWDMLSSFGGSEADGAFMRPRTFTGFEQTEEGDDQPIEGGGGIAGAKSYNSRSGQIFGMLGEMKDEFTRNLSEAQKQELAAVTAFAEMKAAKESEIAAAKASVDSKSEELADTNLRMAEAKQDLEDTTSALSADQKFLLDLKKRCAESDEQYVVRQKERQDEVIAISETIKILTDDDARDLMSNTVGFLQVSAVTHSVSSDKEKKRLRRQRNIRAKEATKLFQLAKQYGDWGLAQLAVSTQLDGFEKVKKAMDDMTAADEAAGRGGQEKRLLQGGTGQERGHDQDEGKRQGGPRDEDSGPRGHGGEPHRVDHRPEGGERRDAHPAEARRGGPRRREQGVPAGGGRPACHRGDLEQGPGSAEAVLRPEGRRRAHECEGAREEAGARARRRGAAPASRGESL